MLLATILQGIASAMGGDVKLLTGRVAASGTGFRNRLINPDFALNQRSYGGGALAGGAYSHDRWKAGVGGCTYAFAQTLPDTTITITAGSLLQVVEACHIEGGSYTASWVGSASGRIVQSGSASAWSASPLTAAGLASGTEVNVEFASGYLARPQFEAGSAANPFARRPIIIEQILAARYCRLVGRGAQIMAVSSTSIDLTCEFGYPEMRASPSVTLLNSTPTVTRAGVGNLGLTFGSIIDAAASRQGLRLYANLGYGSLIQGEQFSAISDDIILATAEL